MKSDTEIDIWPFGIHVQDSYWLGKSYGLIPPEMSIEYSAFESGTELEIEILGELFKTTVIAESPYDPNNEKLRA